MSTDLIQKLIDFLVVFATDLLMPVMLFAFAIGTVSRFLVFWTVRREEWFAKEFHKRVEGFLEEGQWKRPLSFYVVTKRLLEKTYYELFEVRSIMKRRRSDQVMSLSDRVFLIKLGSAFLVRDILKQVRLLKPGVQPKMLQISQNTMEKNPCFSKVFGIIPAASINEILNILPGLFIIGGIFGTFLGIMSALPELSRIDLRDVEGAKVTMDRFLLQIAFSMSTSLLGILLSVGMSLLNAMMSPEKLFVRTVDLLENTLDTLWNVADHNDLPGAIPSFHEDRDPVEALAEEALQKELSKSQDQRAGHNVAGGESAKKVA